MPQFQYIAKNMDGETIKGLLEAENVARARQLLKERNLFPMETVDAGEVRKRSTGTKVKLKEIAMFCRQFHTLLNSGVTIIKSLDILYQQTDSKKLKSVILKVYEGVQKGEMLSDAVKKQGSTFPDLMVNMIETGEASGSLDKVMNKMSTYLDREVKLKSRITSAMIYPIVILVVLVIVVGVLMAFVLPNFISLFEQSGVEIPALTRITMGASKALSRYWYIIAAGVALVIAGSRMYIMSEDGRLKWDDTKMKMPVIKGALTKIYASRFTETMATLLSSGLPLLQTMDITSRVIGNKIISDKILDAREGVRKGLPLSVAVREMQTLPPIVHSMVSVGEESGALDTLLERTARYYDDEVETAIARLVGLVEPVMIVLMAVVVGFVVISIALPMFDMFKTIQ